MGKHETYTDDFKAGIVNLVKNKKKTYRQIQEEFGVGMSAIGRWVREAEQVKMDDGEVMTAAQVRQLQRDKFALQEENEILKKALAIFTPHSK